MLMIHCYSCPKSLQQRLKQCCKFKWWKTFAVYIKLKQRLRLSSLDQTIRRANILSHTMKDIIYPSVMIQRHLWTILVNIWSSKSGSFLAGTVRGDVFAARGAVGDDVVWTVWWYTWGGVVSQEKWQTRRGPGDSPNSGRNPEKTGVLKVMCVTMPNVTRV